MFALLALFSMNLFARDLVVYTTSHPSPSDDGGKSNLEIYWMDLSEKKPRQLTNHPGSDYAPALHPDGKLVAFVTDRWKSNLGTDQIALTDLTKGEVTHLNIGKHQWAWAPSFSADGKFLYFSQARARVDQTPMSSYKIVRYHLVTKKFETLLADVEGNFFDLAPSPDGKTLALRYAGFGEQYIRLLDLSTLTLSPLNPNRPYQQWESTPSWRSNNELTILTQYGEHETHMWAVHAISRNGQEVRQILQDSAIYDYDKICWLTAEEAVVGGRDNATGAFQLFSFAENKMTKLTGEEVWWSGAPDCRRVP